MSRILIGFYAFLLMLFPSSKQLIAQYQSITFDSIKTANAVVDAIATRDIEAIKAMMCKNIKDNVPDLLGEIGKLFDAIDAIGDEAEVTWEWSGGYSETRDGGRKIGQSGLDIYFKDSGRNYALFISWEIINNFSPDERGMRRISLFDIEQKVTVFTISATNGGIGWHD